MRVRAIKDIRYDEFFHTGEHTYNHPEIIYYKGEWYEAKYGDTIDKIHVYYNFSNLHKSFGSPHGYLQFHIWNIKKYFVDIIENRELTIDSILNENKS